MTFGITNNAAKRDDIRHCVLFFKKAMDDDLLKKVSKMRWQSFFNLMSMMSWRLYVQDVSAARTHCIFSSHRPFSSKASIASTARSQVYR